MAKQTNNKLKGLQKMKEEITNQLMVSFFDPADKEYPNKVSRMVNDVFLQIGASVRDTKYSKEIEKHTYLNGEVLRKRRKVLTAQCLKLAEKYRDRFKEIPIEKELAVMMSKPNIENYDVVDNHHFISEAAAIFILDHLDGDELIEALRYLPKDQRSIDMAICNDEIDVAGLSDDLIRSMTYLIQYQNDSLKGHDIEVSFLENAMVRREYAAIDANADVESLDNYQRLCAIMQLLDEGLVGRIVRRFEEDACRIIEMVLSFANDYQGKINRNMKRISEAFDREIRKASNQVIFNMDESAEDDKVLQIIDDLEICEAYAKDKDIFYVDLATISFLESDFADRKAQAAFESLEVANPFETCFSFIYLFVMNDDLIWLTNACIPLLKIAAKKLPWSKDVNFPLDEIRMERYEEYEEELSNEERIRRNEEEIKRLEEQLRAEKPKIISDREKLEKELYSFRYNDYVNYAFMDPEEKYLQKLNLPQLVQLMSGVVMSREVYTNSGSQDDLIKSGMKEDETRLFELFLETVEAMRRQKDLDYFAFDEEKEEAEEGNDDYEKLNEKYKKLQEENQRLKTTIREKNRIIEEERKKNREKNEELLKDLERLQDQNRQTGENVTKDREETAITFPYEVQKRIVIFGGNINWQNALRNLLENVRIVDTDRLPDINMIKNADEIWIQTRTFSHAYYNRIMETARFYKIKVNYFHYPGAENCAREVVFADAQE